jgi:hypothetical protein
MTNKNIKINNNNIKMSNKNAILLSGFLKTYRTTFKDFVEIIVKPSNADVFCVFKKHSSIKDRSTLELDEHDEESYIKECLGENLKSLVWINEVENTKIYNQKAIDYMNNLWLNKYSENVCKSLEHWKNCINTIDQYQRLKLVALEMKKYSEENNIKYASVFRSRPDIYPINGPKLWYNLNLNYKDIYICPHIDYEIRDMMFITDFETMIEICINFPENYPRYMPTTNQHPHKTILSPECQLLQFMIKQHKYKFYFAPLSPTTGFLEINGKKICVMYWDNLWENNIKKIRLNLKEL